MTYEIKHIFSSFEINYKYFTYLKAFKGFMILIADINMSATIFCIDKQEIFFG